MPRDRKRQRGISLAYVAIAMTALLAIGVVAVDIGHLGLSANESQIVADTAATAAVRGLVRNRINNNSAENAVASGQLVAGLNDVDGDTPNPPAIVLGSFNWTNWKNGSCEGDACFTPGGTPNTAARAVSLQTVPNLLAGMFGQTETDVQRVAVAAFSGSCTARPTLPIALGDCFFNAYHTSGNCSSLPQLVQVPDGTDNSCWTSLGPDPASANQVSDYLPESCGGESEPTPFVSVGSQINIMNGQATSILQTVKNCFNAGLKEWLIPLVECGKCNQSAAVTGFATIVIDEVKATGNPKYIKLHSICKEVTGTPGCTDNGDPTVALMR